MKRLLFISLFLNIGLSVYLFSPEMPIAEGVDPPSNGALVSGDVNCNGVVEISDAVYLLNWLFVGGGRPCPLADPPGLVERVSQLEKKLASCNTDLETAKAELVSTQTALAESKADLAQCQTELESCRGSSAKRGVPATGQTTCYDQDGNEIPCDSDTCPGQDGHYQSGCPTDGRFVDNDDGTVTDTCTGLMWQKDTADVDGDGRSTDADRLIWCEALEYCTNLTFAGYDDWRLSSVRELHRSAVWT